MFQQPSCRNEQRPSSLIGLHRVCIPIAPMGNGPHLLNSDHFINEAHFTMLIPPGGSVAQSWQYSTRRKRYLPHKLTVYSLTTSPTIRSPIIRPRYCMQFFPTNLGSSEVCDIVFIRMVPQLFVKREKSKEKKKRYGCSGSSSQLVRLVLKL